MSLTFPDTIEIFQVVKNLSTKVEEITSLGQSPAYVEDFDAFDYTSAGTELKPDIFIGLPMGTTIENGFKIKVLIRDGIDISATEKQRPVYQIFRAGSCGISHIEVYCG